MATGGEIRWPPAGRNDGHQWGIKWPLLGRNRWPLTLAVAMIGNATPIPVVSAVLGHASSDTTQSYYLRFGVERLRRCALDVEDVIEQGG